MADGEQIALTLMANSDLLRAKSYVDRGRSLKGRSDEELSMLLVVAYRAFEKAGFEPQSRERLLTDDIGAEYEIRGVKPPYHLVTEQIDKMVAAVTKSIEAADANRRDEINSEMVNDYEAIKRSEH